MPAPLPPHLDLPDEAATYAAARRLAPVLAIGDVVALAGPLGAGKTSFARALIQARAGAAIDVPSPTFTLVQTYELASGPIWHVDLYRLSGVGDIAELGLDEAFASAITLIEWPDRLGAALPDDALVIAFETAGAGRVAHITSGSRSWTW
jgi:tRNA threonylcarbamoyladenosine biosynthesis protein TsaE